MNAHIKYRQLKAFTLVAEHRSFRQAAERMAVTQSSLSALIRDLEADLGTELFKRTTRSCVLTEAGRSFDGEIRPTLDRLEGAYRHAKKVGAGNLGRLSLAALPSLCSGLLVRELAEYQKRFPGVRISLAECGHERTLDAVRRGDAELGIGSMPRPDPALVFKPLFHDRLMMVYTVGHACAMLPAEWKSLAGFDLIVMMSGPTERGLRVFNERPDPAFEVEHASTALAMVRHGMGVSVLPSSIISNLNIDGLVCRPIKGEAAKRQLGTIQRSDGQVSTPAREFASQLEKALKKA